MIRNFLAVFTGLFLVFILASCNSDVNSPDNLNSDSIELYKFETVESDMGLLKDFGVPIVEGDGVFSIGWNEIFRPFDDDSHIKGMAFAVALSDTNTDWPFFPKRGLNMGIINIDYSGNQVQMHKIFHRKRGVAYSLFNRPFGGSDVLLEYIPNTEYTFNVSGSESFSPATITLTSPASLINITNHSFGDVIDPTQDLTINWDGGNLNGKIAIRVMGLFPPPSKIKGPKGKNMPPKPGPHPREAIVIVLETNPGTYTISAEQIQSLVSEMNAEKIVVEVSQFDIGGFEHDGKTLHTAMRNGASLVLGVQ